jgi:hypothetical protein
MSIVSKLGDNITPSVIKRSRSTSFDTTESSTQIKSRNINKKLDFIIPKIENISEISFAEFNYYCIKNKISNYIIEEIILAHARITNLLQIDEFKNLNFDSKKAILITTVILICKDYKVIDYFDINVIQKEIINELVHIKNPNESWKFIPNDIFYLSQVGYESIMNFIKQFEKDYDLKKEIINHFENINKNMITNSILKSQYDSVIQNNIKLNNFINSKDKIFNLDIINFM